MKDRIQQIITAEQLSPLGFADKVGIKRSSLSHVMAGRNNPSLELIHKILTTFPNLDPDWLIFGKGLMYRLKTDASSSNLFENENHNTKPQSTKIIIDTNSNTFHEVFDKSNEIEEPPKVFISYSWDNKEHEEWVLNLANKLCENGIDIILDKWDLGKLGKPLPNFMEKSIEKSQRVICVMTPNYKKKTEKLAGGVGYEYSIITSAIFLDVDTDKFIPLLKEGTNDNAIPTILRGRKYVDMRSNEDIEELLRDIHNEPKYKRPLLGEKPNFDDLENYKYRRYIEELAKENSTEIFYSSGYERSVIFLQEILKKGRNKTSSIYLRNINYALYNNNSLLNCLEEHIQNSENKLEIFVSNYDGNDNSSQLAYQLKKWESLDNVHIFFSKEDPFPQYTSFTIADNQSYRIEQSKDNEYKAVCNFNDPTIANSLSAALEEVFKRT